MLVFLATIVGTLTGFSTGVGAARMFHSPNKQGLGAFRTLGEINSCNGDPVSHFALGFGFFFNITGTAVGTGILTQDFVHRLIPNWSIALASVFTRKKDSFQIMRSPAIMGLTGMLIGGIILPLIIVIYTSIPEELSRVGKYVLTDAAKMLIEYIMPIIFLIAALDAGKQTGIMSLLFGGLFFVASGSALPGIILGILVGSSWKNAGLKSFQFIFLFSVVLGATLLIAFLFFQKGTLTWEKIIHFDPLKQATAKLFTDIKPFQFDLSILTNTGIILEG